VSSVVESTKNLSSPPSREVAVNLAATDFDIAAVFGVPATALYVGTAGDVIARLSSTPTGTWVTRKNVPAGSYLVGRYVAVKKTGTTAADIVAECY
jgi:hypothetical protein